MQDKAVWHKIIVKPINYRKEGARMLIIENNSVYEIDEECLKQRTVPIECEVYEKIVRKRKEAEEKRKQKKKS